MGKTQRCVGMRSIDDILQRSQNTEIVEELLGHTSGHLSRSSSVISGQSGQSLGMYIGFSSILSTNLDHYM